MLCELGATASLQERFHRSEIHPDSWQPAFIRDPKTPKPSCRGRGRKVFLSRTGRFHRPDPANAAGHAGSLQGGPQRRAGRKSLSRLFAAAAGGIRLQPGGSKQDSLRPQYHAARRHARSGQQERHARSVRQVRKCAGDRRRHHRQRLHASNARSTCAISSTSREPMRARHVT